jgi:hypothetical protein
MWCAQIITGLMAYRTTAETNRYSAPHCNTGRPVRPVMIAGAELAEPCQTVGRSQRPISRLGALRVPERASLPEPGHAQKCRSATIANVTVPAGDAF